MGDINRIGEVKNELKYHQSLLNTSIANESFDMVQQEADKISKLAYLLDYLRTLHVNQEIS